MRTSEMLTAIDEEIELFQKVRQLLAGAGATVTLRKPRKLSPEGRARIAAAQKARWAKIKRSKG